MGGLVGEGESDYGGRIDLLVDEVVDDSAGQGLISFTRKRVYSSRSMGSIASFSSRLKMREFKQKQV